MGFLGGEYPGGHGAVGWIHGANGFAVGPEYEDSVGYLSGDAEQRTARFDLVSPFYDDAAAIAIRNGVPESIEMDDGAMALEYSESGYERLRFWPVPLAQRGNVAWLSHGFLLGDETDGGRVRLTWSDEPDEPEFSAYVLYWDEGLGAGANTVLATIERRSAREYTTGALDAGAYVFRIEVSNSYGKTTNENLSITVNVGGTLAKPSVQSWAVNGAGWTIDVTFDTTDRFWVYSNRVPGWGLSDFIWFGGAFSAKAAGGATWTSPRLWPGIWRFAFCRLSSTGILGPPEYLYLIVTESGGALSAIELFTGPADPLLSIDTDGDVTVRWYWIGTVPTGAQVEIYVNGVFDQFADAGDLTATATGSDGSTMAIKIRGVVGSAYGPWRGPVSISIPASAPDFDHVLTAEVLN